MSENDFYMVLPSNSNPQIHPKNNASNFIVSWESLMYLDSKWKVALTEMTYVYSPYTLNDNYGIEYNYLWTPHINYDVTIIDNKSREGYNNYAVGHARGYSAFRKLQLETQYGDEFFIPKIDNFTILNGGRIRFYCENRFRLKFPNIETANAFGFNALETEDMGFRYSSQQVIFPGKKGMFWFHESDFSPLRNGLLTRYYINVTTYAYNKRDYLTCMIDKFYSFADFKSLINQMKNLSFEYERKPIQDCWLNESTSQICFKVGEEVTRIKFLNGLNTILGFKEREFDCEHDKEFCANFEPQLNRGLNNMYIYASICQPIQVGHTRVPLLKSIWIDVNKPVHPDELRNVVIKNPMYIPLSTSSINSIEINIRNDAGTFIPFPDSAVTSLTLHFKRYNE